MVKPTPKHLTVKEACEILNISRDKIYKLMRAGEIDFVKLPPYTMQAGRRVDAASLERFIRRNRVPAPAEAATP